VNGANLTGRVRVVLADDQPRVLETIVQLLDEEFDVVAAVQDGERAIEAADRLNPDLLLLDISMPVLSGIEAAARLGINESACQAKLIFVTVHQDPDYVEAAFEAGARGYVLKHRLALDLLPAIHEVLQGRTFVSPPMATSNRLVTAPVVMTQ